MNVSNAVAPTPEQFQQFLGSDFTGPVCMVNLLKFKDKAEYAEIATSPEVQVFGVHLSAGLAGQLLIATS